MNEKILLVIATAMPVAACGGELVTDDAPVASIVEESQCAEDWTFQDVELYDGSHPSFDTAFVARHEGAFGRHCSGTLIGADLFLSVAHSSCDVTPGESVGFGCQISASDPNPADPNAAAAANCEWFQSTEVWTYGDGTPGGNPDVSVSRLAGSPGSKYGWVLPARRTPQVGEELVIFQHPGSFGRRKSVAFGPVVAVDGKDVRYRIDSSGGSSGAGVMDSLGFLVGVHRASGCSESGGANTATSMEFVYQQVPQVREVMVAVWMAGLG